MQDIPAAARAGALAPAPNRTVLQPVRYPPYPRKQDALHERFGDEKDGRSAGEGEVHIHTKCPIPGPCTLR